MVLVFIHEARPELLFCNSKTERAEGRFSFRKTIAILAVAAVLTGGLISLAASSYPDGLEWSIERLTGSTELEASGELYQTADSVQETTALLPDYAFKDSDSAFGTTVSGIVGVLVVIGICTGVCCLIKFIRKKKRHE